MSLLRSVFACILMTGLIGCSIHHRNVERATMIWQCKSICAKRFDLCRNQCVDNCSTCFAASFDRSVSSYSKYVHEKQIEGGIVARQLNSYADPLQCRKTTCNCIVDFNTCSQNCTGVIQKRLQAVPLCDQGLFTFR